MARGDHVVVRRTRYYWHHGIDCGDGWVVHYTGDAFTDRRVDCSPLLDFAQGNDVAVRAYRQRFNPDETMERALSRLGDHRYSLVRNNCEHFAAWCCTGKAFSRQVREYCSLTLHGALTTAGVTLHTPEVTLLGTAGLGVTAALRRARRRTHEVVHHPELSRTGMLNDALT